MPVFSETAIQISGVNTPSMSNVTIDCFTARVFQDFFCLSSGRGATVCIWRRSGGHPGCRGAGHPARRINLTHAPNRPDICGSLINQAFFPGGKSELECG